MKNTYVYVVTRAQLFGPENLYKVFASYKEAEKVLRKEFPHMRRDHGNYTNTDYAAFAEDGSYERFIFIHEMQVE